MALDQRPELSGVPGVFEALDQDRFAVGPDFERAFVIHDICGSVRHTGAEVAAGRAEHRDNAAGHVLTAMIADTFDNSNRAAVADSEALAGFAGQINLATSR